MLEQDNRLEVRYNLDMKSSRKSIPVIELINQAESLNDAEAYEEAYKLAQQAARRKIVQTDQIKRLAEIFRIQRKQAPAIRLLQKAIRTDPTDFTVHEDLLRILLDSNRFEDAVDVCEQLLTIFPKHVIARDVLGIAYMQMGLIDKALRVTEDLIRLDPTSAHHHFKKAVLLQQKGEIAPAMASFLRVLDMDMDSEVAFEARDAIDLLDRYQLKQILAIASDDSIFRAKLVLDPISASKERGFVLSTSGMSILIQLDMNSVPKDARPSLYNYPGLVVNFICF